jgi:hypothetical protein
VNFTPKCLSSNTLEGISHVANKKWARALNALPKKRREQRSINGEKVAALPLGVLIFFFFFFDMFTQEGRE